MKKEFIPYEQALVLKELGFDEPCFGYYAGDKKNLLIRPNMSRINHNDDDICTAPTFSQAFRWFREKYEKNIVIFSDGFQWTFDLRWVDEDSLNNYPFVQFPKREVGREMFDTYEESELECLKKLIEIVKINKL